MKNNPLLAHGVVNAIEEISDGYVIKDVEDINTPLLAFHAQLVEVVLINACHVSYEECPIHPRGCKTVQYDIQNHMNKDVLRVSSLVKKENVVVVDPSSKGRCYSTD